MTTLTSWRRFGSVVGLVLTVLAAALPWFFELVGEKGVGGALGRRSSQEVEVSDLVPGELLLFELVQEIGLPPPPLPPAKLAWYTRPTLWVFIGCGALATMVIGGLLAIMQGDPVDAVAGWTVTESGSPQYRARMCPGTGIRDLRVVRASDRAVVFTARLRPGARASDAITISGSSDEAYEKTVVSALDPDSVYTPAATDTTGNAIGVLVNDFRPRDLRPGGVIEGMKDAQTPTGLLNMDDFEGQHIDC